MIYNQAGGELMAIFTVYEAHLSLEKVRAKVSQVIVLQPYQRQGIASKVYDLIYCYFKEHPACF
jgi:GNAT superfamily N-acetyltransferase